MSQISAIFGTDADDEILNALYLIANVRARFPLVRLHADLETRTRMGLDSSMRANPSMTLEAIREALRSLFHIPHD